VVVEPQAAQDQLRKVVKPRPRLFAAWCQRRVIEDIAPYATGRHGAVGMNRKRRTTAPERSKRDDPDVAEAIACGEASLR
jgi:hypothetical protein